MADTFGQMWRRLLIYAPELPAPLAMEFINNAYSKALTAYEWYGQREDGTFFVPAQETTGTVTLAQGSAAIVGSGTAFTSAMVGRQFYPHNQSPVFTILSVTDATHLTLDDEWLGANEVGATYSIVQSYITMPTDFKEIDVVFDPDNRWRLNTRYNQKSFDYWDPQRTMVGTPWAFAAAKPDPTTGAARYELWPRLSAGPRLYGFRYRKDVFPFTADTDTPIRPITGNMLREGALAELAMWKGTEQRPNPSYDPSMATLREARYLKEINKAELDDQNLDQTRVSYWGDVNSWPWAPFPIDAAFFQRHGIAF